MKNGGSSLRRTIESLQSQSLADWEYIVVDGMSTDETSEILHDFSDEIDTLIKAVPKGVANAFNVGIGQARGTYLQLLNADDELHKDKIANSVVALERTGAPFVFGDLIMTNSRGNCLHQISGDPEYFRKLPYFCPRFNHPTFLVRTDCYRKVGLFDEDFKIAMDYEWVSRSNALGLRGYYDPSIVVGMAPTGISANWRKALAEERRVIAKHGNRLGFLIWAWRYTRTSVRRSFESKLNFKIPYVLRSGYKNAEGIDMRRK